MTSQTNQANTLLTHLLVAARRIADSAFVDLDRTANGAPGPGIVSPSSRSGLLPLLLAANATAAAGFAAMAAETAVPYHLSVWIVMALAATLLPAGHLLLTGYKPATPLTLLPLTEVWATLLGLVWATLPALFLGLLPADMQVMVVGMTFAMANLGTTALASRPRAAVIFCAIITGALALSLLQLGGHAGAVLGIFTLLYGLAAAAMVLRSHGAALQRAEIQREMNKQNEIISLLLDDYSGNGHDWLWETGSDGRIVYASRGLAAGLAVAPKALIGRSFDDIVSPARDSPGWQEFRTALLRRKPVESMIVSLPFSSGETWWRMTAKPGFGVNGQFRGYRGVAHDVTGEHQTNRKLVEEKEAAERSSASKSEFLAVMSHELRTPLNAIVGFAELLGGPTASSLPEESRAEHLRTILESSRHLQALINDILDATRIEKGTMQLAEQETDAAELVEIAVKMCREAAEGNDTTIIARVMEDVELRCDMTRIKQVLINLITNALKFSPKGGYVNIAFERQPDGGLAIAVRDDGMGIASENLARVFDPFVQVDGGTARRFGGVGLGLPIARSIAMLHGGDVTLESEPGRGTTARLVLPARRVVWPAARASSKTCAA